MSKSSYKKALVEKRVHVSFLRKAEVLPIDFKKDKRKEEISKFKKKRTTSPKK